MAGLAGLAGGVNEVAEEEGETTVAAVKGLRVAESAATWVEAGAFGGAVTVMVAEAVSVVWLVVISAAVEVSLGHHIVHVELAVNISVDEWVAETTHGYLVYCLVDQSIHWRRVTVIVATLEGYHATADRLRHVAHRSHWVRGSSA